MSNQHPQTSDREQLHRPLFFENLSGIATLGSDRVLLCDRTRGMLTELDLTSGTESFSKSYDVYDFSGAESIAYYDGWLFSVYQNKVYRADYKSSSDRLVNETVLRVRNQGNLTGIAVTEKHIYPSTDQQVILIYHQDTQEITTFGKTPGVGIDDLCIFNNLLYVVDAKEQTVYVFDLTTKQIIYEILTPFENPTAITGVSNRQTGKDSLYLGYSRPSFEVFDTGDSEFKLQLQTYHDERQREPVTDNFIHPLNVKREQKRNFVLSNGFLVDMYYVEKLHSLPEVANEYEIVKNLDWKISLPMDTDRQELLAVEEIGNFNMKIEKIAAEDNRRVAVFSIPEIDLQTERRVFGWKARIKVHGIRHCPPLEPSRSLSKAEREQYGKYLQSERGLDMDSRFIQRAAAEAIRHLSDKDRNDVVKKAVAIRDYIYKKLVYVMDQYHKGPEDVLKSGEGSCGEYLNVFLALLRLNNIPARKCGNYKVPAYKMQAGSRSISLSPDFNHVWLQFYIPGYGWVPLESSADDGAASFRGWPKRYFMALSWYHVECRMGKYFEDVFKRGSNQRFKLGPGELAKKDIKFTVIRELDFS